jgi:hypothetical protein
MTRLTLVLLTLLVVPSWGAEAPTLSTPDGTVRHVLRGLADNRPEVIWQVLPAKHQALIENKIKQTLGTLDAQVHQKPFGNPAQIKNGTWIYRGLKIRNLATGKQMTTVEFEVTDGKVANVTVQL